MSELKVQIILSVFGTIAFVISLLCLVLSGINNLTMVWLCAGIASLVMTLEVEEFEHVRIK